MKTTSAQSLPTTRAASAQTARRRYHRQLQFLSQIYGLNPHQVETYLNVQSWR